MKIVIDPRHPEDIPGVIHDAGITAITDLVHDILLNDGHDVAMAGTVDAKDKEYEITIAIKI